MTSSMLAVLSLFLYAYIVTCSGFLDSRASCKPHYTACSPKGASTQDEPPIGSALSSFYVDMVNTIDANKYEKRQTEEDGTPLQLRASSGGLCCADGTHCLLLQDFNVPFCYDNYTTNYFLPSGSYGQIASGNYTSPDGSTANLISGNYTIVGGTLGNIYGSPSSPSKLDTATLMIPTQYTASGSGSAIPATALGQEITYTTIIPGTTIPPSIITETITVPIISGDSTVSSVPTLGPSSTIQGTTIAPQTSTVTTTLTGASPTKKSYGSTLKPSVVGLIGVALFGILVQIIDQS